MKKLIYFAMAAFIFGAFSLNANAQSKDEKITSRSSIGQTQATTEKNVDGKPLLTNTNSQANAASCCDAKTTTTTATTTAPKEVQADIKVAQQDNWDKLIKDYETAVGQCLTIFDNMKAGKEDKALTQKFNDSLTKVESIGSKIEKAKSSLNRTQVRRYNEAKQKLAVVYQKG